MTKKTTFKPGEKAPVSAQFGMLGPRGGKLDIERTVSKGEILPPTLGRGMSYFVADPTKTR